jgi:serine protease Do
MRAALPLAFIAGLATVGLLQPSPAGSAPLTAPSPDDSLSYSPGRSFAPLVEAVGPAVVALRVEQQVAGTRTRFGGIPIETGPQTRSGEGSGFIISADGLVLTNAHVVHGADTITATLGDGREAQARVLGLDRSMDIALLRLEGDKTWDHLILGDSDALSVGDWVVAIGNPLGLGHTVTAGIVSGKGRVLGHDIYGNESYIQTDAAINQGNSGGPLFDLEGRVVGINSAIISGANTVGFAIPIDEVELVLKQLESKGKISRGYVGVEPIPLTRRLMAQLGVSARSGVVIASVGMDTPAAASGLQQGDVITAVNGEHVQHPAELIRLVGNRAPGERVKMRVHRGSEAFELEVKLGERPGERQGG